MNVENSKGQEEEKILINIGRDIERERETKKNKHTY